MKIALPKKRRIIYLLGLLVALVIADGLLTQFLVGGQRAWEANPFLEPMVGDNVFLVIKGVGAMLCALILWDVYRRYPRLATVVACFGVGLYTVIVLWNLGVFILT